MQVKLTKPIAGLNSNNHLVLFDGVCNLCNASVDFILKRERGNSLRFASLQSDIGQDVKNKLGKMELPDSIVFLEYGKLYTQSTAALRLTKYLRFPFPILQVLLLFPSFIRDVVYRFIAKNRYKWFGKKETCRIPAEGEKEKFLG